MSTPSPETTSEPTEMRWTEPFIGFLFALLIIAGLGVAAVASYDSDSDDATEQDSGETHETEEGDGHG